LPSTLAFGPWIRPWPLTHAEGDENVAIDRPYCYMEQIAERLWGVRMALERSDGRLLVWIRVVRRSSILHDLPRPTRLCGRPLGACHAPYPSHARSSFFHPFPRLLQHIADCLAIFPIPHNSARRLLDCYIRIQLGWISIYRQCSSPDCHFRSSIFDLRPGIPRGGSVGLIFGMLFLA